MTDELFSTLLGPLVMAMQNFLDASFTVVALFGFNAPRVSDIINGLFGIMV